MYMTAGRGFNRSARVAGLRGRGRLGTIATPVAGSMILSSDPVGTPASRAPSIVPNYRLNYRFLGPPVRPGGTQICPAWGCGVVPVPWQGGPGGQTGGWTAGGSPYGSSPLNPDPVALATAQALLQTNPSLLTPAQWQLLVSAGLVASTVPYSSAGQITTSNPLAAGGSPATPTPAPATDIGTMLSTPYLGIPLYAWLAIGAGGLYLVTRPAGRR